MEQNNALALQPQTSRELTPDVWGMLKEVAPDMFTSRLFGVASKEQAVAIMLKGYELGLGVTSSFEFIQVIDGKPSLSPRGALALIQSQGVLDAFKLEDLTDKAGNYYGAECYMKRGMIEFTARFTLDDAKKAQLTEGSPTSNGKRGYGNWEKYPRNMCTWRAIGYAADVVCPDITGGLTTYLKMPEAFEGVNIDDDGNFTKVVTVTPELKAPVQTITLNDLLKDWSAEAIMAANEGKIPATDDEIRATVEKLESEKVTA
ncbi:MAG: hypothetical protein AAGU15_08880 [Anaerolineaceae bacterium]